MATRAMLLAALAFAVAWLVTAMTDEGGVAWGVRAGRTLPTAPLCAALGSAIALQQGRARGEVRALEALGRAPWQNAFACVAGGALAAVAAALLMAASASVDVAGFFPVAQHGAVFHYDAGAFVDRAHGLRVEPDGSLAAIAADARAVETLGGLPRHGRVAAALATAFAGIALPLVIAHILLSRALPGAGARGARRSLVGSLAVWRALLAIAGAAVLTILLFHAAAAGRMSALVAPLPTALLLTAAMLRYASHPWAWPTSRK
jgi:hypothetical protein